LFVNLEGFFIRPARNSQQQTRPLLRCVESLFEIADHLETRYEKAKAHVDHLTQSILAKAFRGELVPQDPNDEPASELLKRIQAERVEAKNKASKSRKAGKSGRKRKKAVTETDKKRKTKSAEATGQKGTRAVLAKNKFPAQKTERKPFKTKRRASGVS